jgi:hypothetical protein
MKGFLELKTSVLLQADHQREERFWRFLRGVLEPDKQTFSILGSIRAGILPQTACDFVELHSFSAPCKKKTPD